MEDSAGKSLRSSVIHRIGLRSMRGFGSFFHFATILGELIITFFTFFADQEPVVWRNWRRYCYSFGPCRLFRMCVFNFLIAFIVTSIAGMQLEQLKIGSHFMDLVIASLLRTVAPLVVAMSVLITSAKNFTQDGLNRALRISPEEEKNLLRYRLVPETVAILFILPFMYVYALFALLIGCLLASLWVMNMIPPEFVQQVQYKLQPVDYLSGIIKVALFALLIGIFKSHYYLLSFTSKRDIANAVTRFVLNTVLWFVVIDFLVEYVVISYGIT